jgi:hypothetical protein
LGLLPLIDLDATGVLTGGYSLRVSPQTAMSALWSLSRLWVAAISRHSDRQAASPRLWNRRILRLNFVFAKMVSIMCWRRV